RDAIVAVVLQDPIGELDRLVDVAAGEDRYERAIEQIAVLRIEAERRAIIGRGCLCVALLRCVPRSEVAAGRGGTRVIEAFERARLRRLLTLRALRGGWNDQYARGESGTCHVPERNCEYHGSMISIMRAAIDANGPLSLDSRMDFLACPRKDRPKICAGPQSGAMIGARS